jgi:hypothetical protein
MAKKKKWIQDAIKRPGAFTAKAKRKKMSTSKFATEVLKKDSKYSEKTKKQARLAKTLKKIRNKKK